MKVSVVGWRVVSSIDVGLNVGNPRGGIVGLRVGSGVGLLLGRLVGVGVGLTVGEVGFSVGEKDGSEETVGWVTG